MMKNHWFWRLPAYFLIVGLCPLLGVWLAQKPVSPYLAFPPIPTPSQPEPFSWAAFLLIGVFVIACLSPFLVKIIGTKMPSGNKPRETQDFPRWGWFGMIFLAFFWIIAWTRFPLFEAIQRFTFAPLWIGYIWIVNALTFRKSGHCCLLDRTTYFLWLFPLSAVFWWSFEYLNRFVSNWYYIGVSDLGPWEYFIHCSLPFSTVLPAVISTSEYLKTFPRLSNGLDKFPLLHLSGQRFWAWSLISISAISFTALALWPEHLFFLVWLAPIALICGLQLLTELPPLLKDIITGDWRRVWRLALAGLICGFFWEMWNINSLAHWKYNVPYVQHFMLFEMPLIGYAGYFPFGIVCGLFADFIMLNKTPSEEFSGITGNPEQ